MIGRRRAPLMLELPQAAREIRAARRSVIDFLAGRSLPPPILADLELVLSELITNAVVHGRGGPITVEADVVDSGDGRVVVLAVSNVGAPDDLPEFERWGVPADPLALSGRGLGIVRQLTDHVDVRPVDERVEVAVRRQVPTGSQR